MLLSVPSETASTGILGFGDEMPAVACFSPLSGSVGAFVGLVCSLIPALVLGVARGFFRCHLAFASLGTASAGVGAQAWASRIFTSGRGSADLAAFCVSGAVGALLAAAATPYVLTGQGARICRPRPVRCCLRRLGQPG
jgi:hypothetical protein